jgi:hypothetical protein
MDKVKVIIAGSLITLAAFVIFVLVPRLPKVVDDDVGDGDWKLIQCGTITDCKVRYYFKTEGACAAMKNEMDSEVADKPGKEDSGYTIRYGCEKK